MITKYISSISNALREKRESISYYLTHSLLVVDAKLVILNYCYFPDFYTNLHFILKLVFSKYGYQTLAEVDNISYA